MMRFATHSLVVMMILRKKEEKVEVWVFLWYREKNGLLFQRYTLPLRNGCLYALKTSCYLLIYGKLLSSNPISTLDRYHVFPISALPW